MLHNNNLKQNQLVPWPWFKVTMEHSIINNTVQICIPNFLKFEFQIVQYSMVDLWTISYVLDEPFEYWTSTKKSQIASICFVFKWSGFPVIKWRSKTRPFVIQPLCNHLNTEIVRYSDPHCTKIQCLICLYNTIKNSKSERIKD